MSSIVRKMYHTQGYRKPFLTGPLICTRDNAWLGDGYYFWYSEEDALEWGGHAKRKYPGYVVYTAKIICDDILDTVFNEDHYKFWLKSIDKISDSIYKNTGKRPHIKELNQYLKERATWNSVSGIMFQDVPKTLSKVISFYYRKRIQLVAFDLEIVKNFTYHYDDKF